MQTNACIFLVILCLSGLSLTVSQQQQFKQIYELPEHLKEMACQEDDPAINECIRKGLQYGIDSLKTGEPGANIPVMDPFHINKVSYQFSNDFVKGKVSLRNIKIEGLSNVKLKKVDFSRKGNRLRTIVDMDIPRITAEGNHKADVLINNVKISSKGSFAVTLTNVVAKLTLHSETYERDGHEYAHPRKITFEPDVGDMKIKADGLLPEPALNDAIVDFINENWRQFYKILFTEAQSTWEPALITLLDDYSAYIPLDILIVKKS